MNLSKIKDQFDTFVDRAATRAMALIFAALLVLSAFSSVDAAEDADVALTHEQIADGLVSAYQVDFIVAEQNLPPTEMWKSIMIYVGHLDMCTIYYTAGSVVIAKAMKAQGEQQLGLQDELVVRLGLAYGHLEVYTTALEKYFGKNTFNGTAAMKAFDERLTDRVQTEANLIVNSEGQFEPQHIAKRVDVCLPLTDRLMMVEMTIITLLQGGIDIQDILDKALEGQSM